MAAKLSSDLRSGPQPTLEARLRTLRRTCIALSTMLVAAITALWWLYAHTAQLSEQLTRIPSQMPHKAVPNVDSLRQPHAAADVEAIVTETATKEKTKSELTEIAALLKTDPKFETALISHLMGQVDQYYGNFIEAANLTPSQTEALRLLLASKQVELFRNISEARSQQAGSVIQAFFSTRDQLNFELTAAIGSEKFNQLKEYESSIGIRNNLNQYRNRLSYMGVPATEEQLTKASATLAARTPQRALERQGNHLNPDKIEPVKVGDLAALRDVFSAEQLKIIEQEVSLQQERDSLVPIYRKAIAKSLRSIR